jgi:hypothetical protein
LRRRIWISLVTSVAAGSLAAVAFAGHVGVTDPNDTRGVLDIRRIDVEGTKRPRWKVITFATWGTKEIFDSGFALVRLDTYGSPRFDYYALVRSNGGRLLGSLWRDRRDKRDYKVGSVAVWRPSRSALSVRVPLRKMKVGGRRLAYGWAVETLFTSSNCPRVCIDFAPDEGRISEPLPIPTPTTSVTPTPTPTPSPTPSE